LTTNFYNPTATNLSAGLELVKKDFPVLHAYMEAYQAHFTEYLAARKPSPW
jgi:hypothetical protein